MKTVEERPVEAVIADAICTVVFVLTAFYFGYHVIAAWLRGAFQAVTR